MQFMHPVVQNPFVLGLTQLVYVVKLGDFLKYMDETMKFYTQCVVNFLTFFVK